MMGVRSGHRLVLLLPGRHEDHGLILSLLLSWRVPPPRHQGEEGYAVEQKLSFPPLEYHRVLILSPWRAKKARGKGEGKCVSKHTAPTPFYRGTRQGAGFVC